MRSCWQTHRPTACAATALSRHHRQAQSTSAYFLKSFLPEMQRPPGLSSRPSWHGSSPAHPQTLISTAIAPCCTSAGKGHCRECSYLH